MPWIPFPTPSNVKVSTPTVRLRNKHGSRGLSISKEAIALSGLKHQDSLVIEHDQHDPNFCRVRRAVPGDVALGILSMPRNEKSGLFATGGRVLFLAGYDGGSVEAECGEGWVTFNAAPLRPKPWRLRIASDQIQKKIIDDLDVTPDDIGGVRSLLGEVRYAEVKSKPEAERPRWLAGDLSSWKASYAAKDGRR